MPFQKPVQKSLSQHKIVRKEDEKEFFFYLYSTQLLGFRRSFEKWVLSRDNISKIQLTSADGKCKLFSLSTYFPFLF